VPAVTCRYCTGGATAPNIEIVVPTVTQVGDPDPDWVTQV
jgi:hypothetical protein